MMEKSGSACAIQRHRCSAFPYAACNHERHIPLARHGDALAFAHANRALIARRLLERLRADGSAVLAVDHNPVTPTVIDGMQGWLQRKGATPSANGPVIIPGSRGDYSDVVKPLLTPPACFHWPTAPGVNGCAASARIAGLVSIANNWRTPRWEAA